MRLTVNFCPGLRFDDARLGAGPRSRVERPKASVLGALAAMMPASAATALLRQLEIDAEVTLAHFAREERRRLVRALVEWPLPVTGTRGYNYAEVTAGGVPLDRNQSGDDRSRACVPGCFWWARSWTWTGE